MKLAERTVLLMYHRVLPADAGTLGTPSCYRLRGTAVTPAELRAHLDGLVQRGIPVLPLAEVVAACRERAAPPPGVILTFDDGYAEWLSCVLPELRARRMAASFFVSSGVHAELARAHPIDEYYYLLDNARVPELALTLPDGLRVVADLRIPQDKHALVHGSLKQRVRSGTPAEQDHILSALGAALAVERPARLPESLYLSRSAWSQLAQDGSCVEAHGHSHRRLTELHDAEIDHELQTCLATLRAHSIAPQHFAYPDGACDERVAARVEAAGLRGALTVAPGAVSAGSDPFFLPRCFARSGVPLDELLEGIPPPRPVLPRSPQRAEPARAEK